MKPAAKLAKSLSRLKDAEAMVLAQGGQASLDTYVDAWVAHRRLLRDEEQRRFSERRDRGEFD